MITILSTLYLIVFSIILSIVKIVIFYIHKPQYIKDQSRGLNQNILKLHHINSVISMKFLYS